MRLSNDELDLAFDFWSARTRYKLGTYFRIRNKFFMYDYFQLKEKIIFEIDKCPKCGSNDTFHSLMLKAKDGLPNVINSKKLDIVTGKVTIKMDYCCECFCEFPIEIYGSFKMKKKDVPIKIRNSFKRGKVSEVIPYALTDGHDKEQLKTWDKDLNKFGITFAVLDPKYFEFDI